MRRRKRLHAMLAFFFCVTVPNSKCHNCNCNRLYTLTSHVRQATTSIYNHVSKMIEHCSTGTALSRQTEICDWNPVGILPHVTGGCIRPQGLRSCRHFRLTPAPKIERITTHPTRKVDVGPDLQPGGSRPRDKTCRQLCGRAEHACGYGRWHGAWWRQRQERRRKHLNVICQWSVKTFCPFQCHIVCN